MRSITVIKTVTFLEIDGKKGVCLVSTTNVNAKGSYT